MSRRFATIPSAVPAWSLPRGARLAHLLIATAALAAGCGAEAGVQPPPAGVASVRMNVGSLVTVVEGDRRRFTAQAFDAEGVVVPSAPLSWSVDDTTLAVVDTSGEVLARAAGNTTLRVLSGRVGWSTTLVIVRRAAVAAIALYPRRLALAPGDTAVMVARRVDSTGIPIRQGAVSYRSSAPEIATVSQIGTVVGRQLGVATITALADGRETTSEVTVVGRVPRRFSIALRVVGDTTRAPMDLLRQAISRWERVVVAGAPPQRVVLGADSCASWIPAIDATVEHVLVFVHVAPIDGPSGILGGSGVCALRASSRQPVIGFLELDAADLAAERTRGSLGATITHELGHTLGFASAWFSPPSLVEPRREQQGYAYVGQAVRAAAVNWGAITDSQVFWLENRGGLGSAASHWHPSMVGDRELMTAFGFGGDAPISTITVAAMRDLGYTVDDTGADWTYPPSSLGPVAASRSVLPEATPFERVSPPRWILGSDGRPLPR